MHVCIQIHFYMKSYIHTFLCLKKIHDFSICDFQISIFLRFPYFRKYGNSALLEIWNSILMPQNNFVSAEKKPTEFLVNVLKAYKLIIILKILPKSVNIKYLLIICAMEMLPCRSLQGMSVVLRSSKWPIISWS